MPRTPRPWYRKSKNAWFVCLDGKQVLLAKGRRNKAEAQRNYHELMLLRSAAETVESPEATVAAVCECYLDWCQRHRRPGTYGWYHFYLQDFAEMHGRTKAVDLKPFHVTRWVDSHRWNETTAPSRRSSGR